MSPAARHTLREALTWGAMALAGFALIYFYDDIFTAIQSNTQGVPDIVHSQEQPKMASFAGEVHVRANPGGHFLVEASINGRPAKMMADTGASVVVLSFEDAERLGLSPHSLDFSGIAQTANGTARVAPVTLDRLRVEDITVHDVPAAVAERGALTTNLLGMSFLGRLRSFEMRKRELILVQ